MNDKELIINAQNGDDGAMDEMLKKYSDLVKKRVQSYYSPDCDRDDLIQEGMYGLYKAVMTYESSKGVKFGTYASKIINNELTSVVRRAYSHSGEVLRETDLCDVSEYSSGKTLESEILGEQERDDALEKVSKELSSFERNVINLYVEDNKSSEIANILKESQKTIDNALARVKRKIREKFEEWEEKK